MTRVFSWNVNGVRAAATKGLLEFLQREQPDVLCLQETKAQVSQLGQDIVNPPGYRSYWASAERKGYSGVAVYSRSTPLSVDVMSRPRFDCEGRVLLLQYPAFVLITAYFPNSQDGGRRLDYKIDFATSIHRLCDRLVAEGRNLVLCGDYNIAHKPIDLEHPTANENNAGYLPEERAWMDGFIGAGYCDTFRLLHPEPRRYSWWSYRYGARQKNVGWRIDYHCVNRAIGHLVRDADIHHDVYGSDHCPISVALDL
ncbi:MAG: exodeoxyribonuclease III [Spirochaetaceae bacterium]|nr:MAG: exodeoxyribonuclease III [Spirochaetaceae bacterium]